MVEHDDLEDEHEEIDDTEVVNIDEESDNICDEKYQDQATKCEVGCKRFDEKRFPGNARAGRR